MLAWSVPFQGAGPGAPGELASQAPAAAGEAPQFRPVGSPCPWAAGCRRRERSSGGGHPAAPERGVPGSSFTPDASPFPRPPPGRAVGGENETRLESP